MRWFGRKTKERFLQKRNRFGRKTKERLLQKRIRYPAAALLCAALCCLTCRVDAESGDWEAAKKESEAALSETGEWMQAIRDEISMSELDEFVTESIPLKTTFSELTDIFLEHGFCQETFSGLLDWIRDLLFYELSASKPFFLQMLIFTLVFSAVRQIFELKSGYVSDLSFLMIYATMASLLVNNFILVSDIAQRGISHLTEYMTALVPAFATTLLCSGSAASAGAFYELSFLVITLLTYVMNHVLIPAVHIYLLICLLNQMFWEDKLSKTAELIESGVRLIMRTGVALVLGISCVQSLLTPAQDRLSGNVMLKTMSALPGIGSIFGSAGDVLLGCGMLIKNSVGAAALIVMVLLCLAPVIKVFLFTLLYRILTALLQPVADKRIVRCMNAAANACRMYLRLMIDSMMMFFLSVALLTASTSFIM